MSFKQFDKGDVIGPQSAENDSSQNASFGVPLQTFLSDEDLLRVPSELPEPGGPFELLARITTAIGSKPWFT